MKKIAYLILLIAPVFLFSSCKKYEEGPSISLRSKTARVANKWKIDAFFENGVDKTTDYNKVFTDLTYEFTKDGIFSYSFTVMNSPQSGSGKWGFQNEDKEIKLSGVSGSSSETCVILKLKNDEFWYYIMDGSDKQEYHLVTK